MIATIGPDSNGQMFAREGDDAWTKPSKFPESRIAGKAIWSILSLEIRH